MQKREKVLLLCVLLLLGVVGVRYSYSGLQGRFDEREQRIASLQSEINRKQLQVRKGQKAGQRLADYEARSLPANRELARSLYQNWLISLIDKAGLAGGVSSQAPQAQRAAFDRLSFSVSGQGRLSQVVDLLHSFYSGGHLHQARLLTLKPLDGGQRFDILLGIEALALPGATPSDQLTEAAPRFAVGDLASYQMSIAERNIFAPYAPPKSEPKPPPAFDVARYTTISAILVENGRPQVWLNNRTTGQLLRLGEGSPFEVGTVRGTIQRIGLRDVEVLADGQRRLLALGENLRQGTKLDDGQR